MRFIQACCIVAFGIACVTSSVIAAGPLRVHSDNPRYFTDGSGRAIYLTGSHVWNNLVDMGPGDPPPSFNFDAYLDFLDKYGHNFIRLWTWEHAIWDTSSLSRWSKQTPHIVAPLPWARQGSKLDGKTKFDLTRFNEDYFTRLRSRVAAADKRGIYVSVMLFEGWGVQFATGAWAGHPFNVANNVNDIDGDANKDGRGLEIHTLSNPAITHIQEAYVKKVVDTVNDLDNVLYEISNENHPASTQWQYHMIRCIKTYEKAKPNQHPVGMTFQYKGGSNETLLNSPADWFSPNHGGGYRDNPPPADGSKVIISDTDHLWGIGGNQTWVWKSFTRGLNPIFMDPYDGVVLAKRFDPQWEPIRRSMGYARQIANRMNLAAMSPRGDLATTKFCLADPGREYLVYAPNGGNVTVDLTAANGELTVEWFDPTKGRLIEAGKTTGGGQRKFAAAFAGHAVLHLVQDPLAASKPEANDLKRVEQQRTDAYADTLEDYLRKWLVDDYSDRTAKAWKRDYSSERAFLKSVEPNRKRWRNVVKPPDLEVSGDLHRRPYQALEKLKAEWLTLPLNGITAEGLLVIPSTASTEAPVPLVLAQHGIGSTPERPFGLLDERDTYHHYAERLVKAGFAVLAPMNLRGVDRRNRIERLCRLADTSLPGIEMVRMQRLLDEVLKDTRIDGERVGMWGVSLGGTATMFWMPLEPRIKVGVVAAWFNHRRNKMAVPDPRYSCFLETEEEHAFFQGWLTEFTDSDVVSLICPRPLQIQHGKEDRIAHWPQVVEEFKVSQAHYNKLGVAQHMELDLHEGGHEPRVESGIRFLKRWLMEASE